MTKVLFLRLAPWMGILHPHPQDIPYAYEVAQAAALLDPNRFEVIFIDGMAEKLDTDDIISRITSMKPDILALTTISSAERFAVEIFRRIKLNLPELYIIGFGQHAHYNPQSFLNNSLPIDACVYGESEVTLIELVKERPKNPVEKEKVKGIYYWDQELKKTQGRPLAIDLDHWPMPRYEIFKNHDYRIVSMNFSTFCNIKAGWILASRGCPYECTICSPAIRRSFGTQVRKISPKRVADTFRLLEDKLGVNTICFGDDVFTLDTAWVEEICDELIKKKNKINWSMGTRVDRVSAPLIKKMKAAGLRSVGMGVESGSERILQDINKKISLEQIDWAISEFAKNGISINVTAIVGHVDETVDELKETFSLLKRSKVFFIQLHYLSPYPGTKVAQIFKERLKNIDIDDVSHYNTLPMNVSKIPDEILLGSIQKFYLDYYTSFSFMKKYIQQRIPYVLSNPGKELKLFKESLAYFLLSANSKNQIKKLSGTEKTPGDNMKVFVPRQSISIGGIDFCRAICRLPFRSGSGQEVIKWEKKFSEFIGVPYAVSFISERAGTYFTLKALKEMHNWERPEIICPSYTFFSVPWAVKLAGWKLRFADVSGNDLNMDPESLKRQINERTKAVILTHLNGKPAKMLEIERIVKENNLRLLEDCAHAIGITINNRQVGSWDIGCFSFGDGKNLGTFGGGMITTSDPVLAKALKVTVSSFSEQSKLRILKKILDSLLLKILTTGIFYPLFLYPLLRWFGYLSADSRKNDFLNFFKNTKEKDLIFKFSDVQAIVGLSQLKNLDKRNEIRRANSRAFRRKLSQKTLVKMLPWDGEEPHTMLHDAIVLDSGMGIVKESLKRGIDLRLDYCGNCRNLPGLEESFPGEDAVGRNIDGKIFFVPNHLGMNPKLSEKTAIILETIFNRRDND